MNEDNLKPLNYAKKSTVTIPPSGYARWYTISDKDEGKMLKVSVSSNGSFAVYDDMGTCLYFSVIGGKDQTTLPAGGTIVFAGDAGTKFEVSTQ